MQLNSSSESVTRQIGVICGESLAKQFKAHKRQAFIRLSGTLGAGKTTFAKGFIEGWLSHFGESLGLSATSPTYNLVRTYGAHAPIAHFDLYRLESLAELEQIGYEAYFYEGPACLVEWLENMGSDSAQIIPKYALHIQIAMNLSNRTLEIERIGSKGLDPDLEVALRQFLP